MSPITRATRPSASSFFAPTDGPSPPEQAAVKTPSKPSMRKAPQRVGKSASAIFFTLSNPMLLFYFARGLGNVGTDSARNPSRVLRVQHARAIRAGEFAARREPRSAALTVPAA